MNTSPGQLSLEMSPGQAFEQHQPNAGIDPTLAESFSPPRTYGGGTSTNQRLPSTTGRTINASGESAASAEDMNTPKQNLVQYGSDDVPKPIMKSAGQKDVNPDPGHVIINADTHEIVKSGNLAPRLAQGLLARYKALHGTPLGDSYP
jgi:hypothetical protein